MRDRLGDRVRAEHVLEAIGLIERFMAGKSLEDLNRDPLLKFGVVKQLEIIGEALSRITQTTCAMRPEVPWKKIILMRHILVHDYYKVDVPTVWSTVTDDIPPLKVSIAELLKTLPVEPI